MKSVGGKDGLGIQQFHMQVFLYIILLLQIINSLMNVLLALDWLWPRISLLSLQSRNMLPPSSMLGDCCEAH